MSLTKPLANSSTPMVGKQLVPSQLAVIAPLETEGPITYQTLLEYLDAAPIPYQLWLLTQIETGHGNIRPTGTKRINSSIETNEPWAYSPEFSPVNGVDATPVAWPSSAAPRVITIQYDGLAINQAINWAIRQAHGDMILVLDSGLSGLMQLRQSLDEIANSIAANNAANSIQISPAVEGAPRVAAEIASVEVSTTAAELPVPGAFNRRLVERLEQWGVALQHQSSLAKERRHLRPAEIQAAIAESAAETANAETISRVDGESQIHPAKRLPKFVTRFHEFI
jgi:hypothetical protein